jgi:hypothetical protein
MRKNLLLLLTVFLGTIPFRMHAASVLDPVVVEITDTTLDNVYYHQQHFSVPTKLVFTNLTSVSGFVYFHQNTNLVEVDFPALTQTGSYFYFHGNVDLEMINAPNLHTVYQYVYAVGNTSLATFNVCGLTEILSNDPWQLPYYYLHGNTAAVDASPSCFSLGGPQNLALSGTTAAENEAVNTVVGTISADTNYPSGTLTYYLPEFEQDNNFFRIVGNQLLTRSVFDYETKSSYTIIVGVRNQLGEKTETEFTINVTDVALENVTVIEITDANLDNIEYIQHNFEGPTKLVFTNLTSVGGHVMFHQNINLVEVDFPLLAQTGDYFYFHQNQSLTKINAPNLQTVHNYLYVNGHDALTELNVCGLEQIITLTDFPAYYYIENNPILDSDTTCLEDTTFGFAPEPEIVVEETPNTLVGTFTTDSDVPLDYFFTDADGHEVENTDFIITGNGLYLVRNIDYYTNAVFDIHVGAIRMEQPNRTGRDANNGLNEKLQVSISLNLSTLLGTKTYSHTVGLAPNPASDYFEIATKAKPEDVVIFDITGRQLQGYTVNGNRIDVGGLPNGNYVVRATVDGKSIAKKLVVRK